MRFDPRYIPGEEAPLTASGEIDLPDDLLELASQLRDDAAYLADKYPADKYPAGLSARSASEGRLSVAQTQSASTSDARTKVGLKQAVAAVVSIAAALAITIAVSPMFWNESPAQNNAPVAATPTVIAAPISTADVVADPPAAPRGSRTVSLPWAPRPAVGEVTGPELEGLLDLWQNDEKPAETRISI